MGFGFTTARNAVPDAHELTAALAEAFDELVAKSRPRKVRVRTSVPAARRTAAGRA